MNRNGNSSDLNIRSISSLDTVEFEKNNIVRKVNFSFMIPNFASLFL